RRTWVRVEERPEFALKRLLDFFPLNAEQGTLGYLLPARLDAVPGALGLLWILACFTTTITATAITWLIVLASFGGKTASLASIAATCVLSAIVILPSVWIARAPRSLVVRADGFSILGLTVRAWRYRDLAQAPTVEPRHLKIVDKTSGYRKVFVGPDAKAIAKAIGAAHARFEARADNGRVAKQGSRYRDAAQTDGDLVDVITNPAATLPTRIVAIRELAKTDLRRARIAVQGAVRASIDPATAAALAEALEAEVDAEAIEMRTR
ncbi:MAG TPA: hypothetical protein VGM56_14150, partial [Byssovorax sp.]